MRGGSRRVTRQGGRAAQRARRVVCTEGAAVQAAHWETGRWLHCWGTGRTPSTVSSSNLNVPYLIDVHYVAL
jgi:hypothetical protein